MMVAADVESALPTRFLPEMSGLTSAATGDDEWNPRLGRDAIQGKIAAGFLFARKRTCLVARLRMKKGNPAGTAGGGRKRLAFDDGGGREGEMRHEQQIFDAP